MDLFGKFFVSKAITRNEEERIKKNNTKQQTKWNENRKKNEMIVVV